MPYDLIIPDIHEDIDKAEAILNRFPDSRNNIFLGDYWDSFEWEFDPSQWHRVAHWLLKISADPKNILIAGNHDVHYYDNGHTKYMCSGYISLKHQMIGEIMPSNWLTRNCRWVHSVEYANGLTAFSHAGINVAHIGVGAVVDQKYIKYINDKISDNFFLDLSEPMLHAGRARGGRGIGGITWQDWNREYTRVEGLRQIVGHTPDYSPRWRGQDLCLDTKLNHVALIDTETGEITVESAL